MVRLINRMVILNRGLARLLGFHSPFISEHNQVSALPSISADDARAGDAGAGLVRKKQSIEGDTEGLKQFKAPFGAWQVQKRPDYFRTRAALFLYPSMVHGPSDCRALASGDGQTGGLDVHQPDHAHWSTSRRWLQPGRGICKWIVGCCCCIRCANGLLASRPAARIGGYLTCKYD